MNKKNSKSSIKQGFTNYSSDKKQNESKLFSKEKFELDISDYKYPKGITSLIFILLVAVASFLFAFLFGKKHIVDALTISSGISFFCCLIWWLARNSFSRTQYNSKKFFEFLTFKEKRKNKDMVNHSLAVNNIESFEDYQKYCKIKNRNSKIIFLGTFILFTLFFIIMIILSIILL